MPQKPHPEAPEPAPKPAPKKTGSAKSGAPTAGPDGGYTFPFARSAEEDEIREMYGWGV